MSWALLKSDKITCTRYMHMILKNISALWSKRKWRFDIATPKNLVVLNVLKLTWRDWGQQNKPCKVHCEANQIDRPHFWSDIGVAVEHLFEMANMFSKKLSCRAFFITNQSMDETKYDFCMSLEVLNVWFNLYKGILGCACSDSA